MLQKKKTGQDPVSKTYRHLNKVKHINNLINDKQQEIDYLRSVAGGGSGYHTESDRVQTSGHKDRIGDCCTKAADLCTEINQDIDTYVDYRTEVIASIDLLDDPEERSVLYRRYLQFMTFSQIAYEMQISQSTVYRIHRAALEHLGDIMWNH